MKKRVLITTVPFAKTNRMPLELLEGAGIEYLINPHQKKLTETELLEMVQEFDAIIAGTEVISSDVMDNSKELKIISRVGIGLDGVDLNGARERDIKVTYTPDAPAPSVAELTVGNIIALLRSTHVANLLMHRGEWDRLFGRRIAEVTIGIVGAGRIGGRVLRRLSAFGSPRVLVNDIAPNLKVAPRLKLEWVDKETLFSKSDIISFHIPLTKQTRDMVTTLEIEKMKPGVLLLNLSRGGIINEKDLADALRNERVGGAAIDCFDLEPYVGPLSECNNCLLTSHMGSMSIDCRSRMEIEATQEIVRYFSGQSLKNIVPDSEYLIQING